MNSNFENYLLEVTKASHCGAREVIQSLWSDYGKITRYELFDSEIRTVVVKQIALNKSGAHPRGWNTNFAHQRKVKSYQVESYFYKHWSHFCDENCIVPKFVGARHEGMDHWIILEDLNSRFPLRKEVLNMSEVKVCLKWLANFHAIFLNQSPKGLWAIGTYWHLDTRPDEFQKIENPLLKENAHLIDQALNGAEFQTVVHGDAKLANFCFSENGKQVAAVDFQYVGGGCGMKDVVYFLGSCLSSTDCEIYEVELLDFYFSELQKAMGSASKDIDFKALEEEWRGLYPFACADFTRFLLGWMPSHQKVNRYHLLHVEAVLASIN